MFVEHLNASGAAEIVLFPVMLADMAGLFGLLHVYHVTRYRARCLAFRRDFRRRIISVMMFVHD